MSAINNAVEEKTDTSIASDVPDDRNSILFEEYSENVENM